ncbi:MAG: endolytic transglycosylase MltG, partial [Elusimicrobia bacterium]|nr:endolytic transglycosylase MltG [Elusimicrobiota bacterium]
MKRRVFAVLAAVLFAAALTVWLLRPGPAVQVEIPERLSARQTAELLAQKDVIVSVPLFRLLLKLGRFDRHLKPGTYALRVHEWPGTVIRKLTLGQNEDVKVVIPEGFRASQIAERLAADGIADAGDFAAYVKLRKLEGRLFPSTYHFPPGYGAERVAARMNEAFERELGSLYEKADPKPELTLDDTLILASIVEREAVLPQDRPIIAAVYLNRLKKRMPMQADPT